MKHSDAPKNPESALNVMPGVSIDPARVVQPRAKRRQLSVDEHVHGVLNGDRIVLARTITLVESSNPEHRLKAREVLDRLAPHTGRGYRVGITGVPGVGKSTFIEALGMQLVEAGKNVAVLAVDPSSQVSGGSILGDKTRMARLATEPRAMVRPSPCGGWVGGVARGTREAMLVCEAGGFDVILVETVGVGQSETQVASMVDCFLLLMLAGAGDELQGIKRGIMELVDVMAINKADGENRLRAQQARSEYLAALRMLPPATADWKTPVLACSSVAGEGVAEIWRAVEQHREHLDDRGLLDEKRRRQDLYWMTQTLEQLVRDRFYARPNVAEALPGVREDVLAGRISPTGAAERLLELGDG